MPDTADELSLHHDELLPEQPVLGDKRGPTTEQSGGDGAQEPNQISHDGFPYPDRLLGRN